ncbi:amidohydrolase family-domain-containing protein [Mycena pura]|uniref:Amidohydrolase family-domain-containing protein n=1 Tax=Mycena pura TaxID=153505 RepID=A0AAD6VKL3_9AGAR|nr:amidohydrolase family-domain-containing protein [Mycena pura]
MLLPSYILLILVQLCASNPVTNDGLVGADNLVFTNAQQSIEGNFNGNLLLINGQIHTMSANDDVVSVVAIKYGKIVYLGGSQTDAEQALQGTHPRLIDLHGRVAIPGLIDCHNHIVLMGNRPGHHTPLENAYSIADVQDTYMQRAAGVPPGEFITTIGGFHPNQFRETRLPTLAELDEAAPDNPVFISIGFFGPATTNSLGKKFFESLAPDPVVVAANGTITVFLENNKALLALRQRLTFSERERGVRDAMAYATSLGVTTHLDQGAFQATGSPLIDGSAHENNYAMHLPFLSVYDDGEGTVRLRINFLHMDESADVPALTQRLMNAFRFFGNDMVRTGAIGEFIAANYSGGPVFEEAGRRIARAGWRAEVHSLTETDYQTEIQGFEVVDAEVGIKDLRWVVAHVPFITEEYLARLKKLMGGVNLSAFQYLAGTGPNSGPPYRMVVDSGIPAGIGGDGMQIAMMNPWVQIYYATTGKSALGEQINEGQQISRLEALHLYTRANQWFLGGPDEKLLGALEVGRLGDIVVLSDDYFSVADDQLRNLTSVLTVVGGVVVHHSAVLGQ